MKNAQKRVEAFLRRLVSEGSERGVQVAAYLDGELVVDAWAGVADAAIGRPVDGETLFPVFSCTKGIAATLAHRLVERGALTYETRIAEVWPEFGANGKEKITLRHALEHTAALPYMPADVTPAEICDWDVMCAAVAALHPAWEPGTRAEYHAVTYGWIVGEVLRRVDGRSFDRQMREEICHPLGIVDMYVGIPDAVEPRVAILEEIFEKPWCPPSPDQPQGIVPSMQPLHVWMNRPEARRACLPASTGIMSARAIARHYAALLPGGVDGVELLSPERVRQATRFQGDTFPLRVGGYQFYGQPRKGKRPAFGHDGYGGSCGIADPEGRLAIGLTKNLFSQRAAHGAIVAELRDALGVPQ